MLGNWSKYPDLLFQSHNPPPTGNSGPTYEPIRTSALTGMSLDAGGGEGGGLDGALSDQHEVRDGK